MKIKNVDLEIVQGDIVELAVDAIVKADNTQSEENSQQAKHIVYVGIVDKEGKTDEHQIRKACADALLQASDLKYESVAFPALGYGVSGFPAVASAKIMAQEILKFAKFQESSIKRIVLCLFEEELYQIFNQTVTGYVTHIQDDLGNGPYTTVDAIIELPEGIVVIERSNPPYGWALPGGFVDCGESLEDSVRREAKEETSLELEDLRQFHTYSDPSRDPRFHTVSTVFIAKGKGTPQFGDDAKGLKIVPYEELLNLEYAFDHKDVIRDYLAALEKRQR